MKKPVSLLVVILFGFLLGQPALTSILDVNVLPQAIETAGESEVPLEDDNNQSQQTFDEEEEEKHGVVSTLPWKAFRHGSLSYDPFSDSYLEFFPGIPLPPPQLA